MSLIINEIIKLYSDHGDAGYGEDVTQTEHALQCATLAQRENAPAELVVAALLHDIGHLLEEAGQEHGHFRHDKTGADFLAGHFPATVSESVRLHAQAKRYLCTIENQYYDTLSAASKYSLEKQGGLMTVEEAQTFSTNPYFSDAVRLRRWDDHAKDPALRPDSFCGFRALMTSVLRS